jgi:hypothetical protein
MNRKIESTLENTQTKVNLCVYFNVTTTYIE